MYYRIDLINKKLDFLNKIIKDEKLTNEEKKELILKLNKILKKMKTTKYYEEDLLIKIKEKIKENFNDI